MRFWIVQRQNVVVRHGRKSIIAMRTLRRVMRRREIVISRLVVYLERCLAGLEHRRLRSAVRVLLPARGWHLVKVVLRWGVLGPLCLKLDLGATECEDPPLFNHLQLSPVQMLPWRASVLY